MAPSTSYNFNPTLTVQKRRSTADVTTPIPLSSDDAYTPDCVQQRLDDTEKRLASTKRYLTPNSEKLLTLYRDACYDFLLESQAEDWSAAEKTKRINEVRGYETDMSTRRFLQDVSEPSLLAEIVNFRQYSYYARYGDYAAHLVSKLRKEASVQPQSQFADSLSGSQLWSAISAQIKQESLVWARNGAQDPSRVKTTYAVYENCNRVGISHDNMVMLIHLYADRNLAFHRGLQEYLENQQYALIAQCLYDDLKDLSSIATPNQSGDETAMRAILEQLRDQWFDTSDAPNQPLGWCFLPEIKKVHAELQKSKQKRQDMMRQVAQNAAQRIALSDEQEDLLVQAATQPLHPPQLPPQGPGSPTITGKGKSKFSIAKPVDVSDRKKAWNAIMDQQAGQYNGITATIAKQRQINRMVSAYGNPYGEDPPQDA
ncbi:MAG: hypothetical protein LQ343_001138 [Gyalolechia ehrenbergii]|nr:MAG: hypothetical protein LQ343_001138 [Gyalolechia ehrenbergii]